MKKVLLIVAVAVMALLADSQLASAGKCGGGRGGCGSKKSCRSSRGGRHSQCSSGCQSCGYQGCSHQGCGSCGAPCGAPCGAHALGTTATAATVVVNLPEDAQLTIDGEPTTSTSANRVFVTPALEGGKEYQYTFKAQVVRDGKIQTTTQQVTVRAGEVSRVELKVDASSVAAQ